ncbi:MAG: long-chain fatty acid--CoA ligase [Limnohabitans sp.]
MKPHHAHWPLRVPHQFTPSQTTLWHNLSISAQRFSRKTALDFLGRQTTYHELAQQAERLAAWLAQKGVQKGDRVLLYMQNCPQWVVAHFGILRANAVVVPVNPMNRAKEIEHYIQDAQAKVAITTADLAAYLAQASDALPPAIALDHVLVTEYTDAFDPTAQASEQWPLAWQDWLLAQYPAVPLAHGRVHAWHDAIHHTHEPPTYEVQPDDLAVLPYTSGTTGLPKGCMHPHRTLMHNAMAAAMWHNATQENIALCVVPMFHITGMVAVMHTSVYVGATIVLMPRWDRDYAGHLISSKRVTHWTNIPTMVIDLLGSPRFDQYDLRSLVAIGGGGAAMPQAVAQRLWELYGLRYVEGYGLTETAAPSHSNPPDRPKQQCLGIPFIGVDARVIDPDTLQEVASGEQGEIIMRGPQIFDGYWQRPEATDAAFINWQGQRYFRSGDLGHVDDEGYFFITDRLKRMINASGFKVWPAEVEALMFRHPAIQEACVVAAHDSYRGETVKAFVVLRQSHQGQVSEADILDWCKANMAVYKAPRLVSFLEALPKSGSGKVMWRSLQEAEMAKSA